MQNSQPVRIQSKPEKILIFDSGVGALSVFQEIRKNTPAVHCTLALDNALFPYGLQEEHQLIHRVTNCIDRLISEHQPDMVVIACNTASTLVLDHLRARFSVPFVGVVPAIKPAAAKSKSKVIGLLATPATVERDYTNQLIDDFALNCEVIKVGSSELVTMAEQKLRGSVPEPEQLTQILQPFIDRMIDDRSPTLDTIVLACTHFPLLKDEIFSVLNKFGSIDIVDSGIAIAQRVNSLLDKEMSLDKQEMEENTREKNGQKNHQVILSAEDRSAYLLEKTLLQMGCSSIKMGAF